MTNAHPMLIAMAKAICRARFADEGYVDPNLSVMTDKQWLHFLPDARAALTALLDLTPDVVEVGEIAALVALTEHGLAADTMEVLTHGDGRGTIAPHALRKAISAATLIQINHILKGQSQ